MSGISNQSVTDRDASASNSDWTAEVHGVPLAKAVVKRRWLSAGADNV